VVDLTMQPTQASLWLRQPHAPSAVVDGVWRSSAPEDGNTSTE